MATEKTVEEIILEAKANWLEAVPLKVQQALDRLRELRVEIEELQDQNAWLLQLPAAIRERAEIEIGNPGHVWLERTAKFIESGTWPDKA